MYVKTIEVLQAKVRNATITASSPKYKGSITIDQDILDDLGVVPWQVCHVNSMDGFRGVTYILAGKRGTGCVEANGALSAHILKGDIIHINIYCNMSIEEAQQHEPSIVESNEPYIQK